MTLSNSLIQIAPTCICNTSCFDWIQPLIYISSVPCNFCPQHATWWCIQSSVPTGSLYQGGHPIKNMYWKTAIDGTVVDSTQILSLELVPGIQLSLHDPLIKLTSRCHTYSVNLFEITVYVRSPELTRSVHYKPTNHACLPSLHLIPRKILWGRNYFFPRLLLGHLCHDDDDYRYNALEMLDVFHLRGYPGCILTSAFSQTQQISRADVLIPCLKQQNSSPIHSFTHHHHSISVTNTLLRHLFLHLGYSNIVTSNDCSLEVHTDLNIYFIDYIKAFYRVRGVALVKMLADLHTYGKDLRLHKWHIF